MTFCLQCFDTVGWVSEREPGLLKVSDMLVWLSVWSEVHMVQLMPQHPTTPSSLASFKSRLVYLSGTGLPSLSWKRDC